VQSIMDPQTALDMSSNTVHNDKLYTNADEIEQFGDLCNQPFHQCKRILVKITYFIPQKRTNQSWTGTRRQTRARAGMPEPSCAHAGRTLVPT